MLKNKTKQKMLSNRHCSAAWFWAQLLSILQNVLCCRSCWWYNAECLTVLSANHSSPPDGDSFTS